MSGKIINHTKGWGGQSAADFGGRDAHRPFTFRTITNATDIGTDGERGKCENIKACSSRARFAVEFERGGTVRLCPAHTPKPALSISPSLGERMLWATREGDLQSEIVVYEKNGVIEWEERHRVVKSESDSGVEWHPLYEVTYRFEGGTLRVVKTDYRDSVESPNVERFGWELGYNGGIPTLDGEPAINSVIRFAEGTAEKLTGGTHE